MVGAPTFTFVAVPLALAVSMTALVTAEAQQSVVPEAARGVPLTAAALEVTKAPDSLVRAPQEALGRELSRLRVPGIQASVRVGRFTWSGTSGYKDLKRKAPPDTSDILPIGSVTKTFTAGVVLKLSERGLVNLDDPIPRWFGLRAGAAAARHRRLRAVGSHRNLSRVRRRGRLLAEGGREPGGHQQPLGVRLARRPARAGFGA